MRYLPIEEAQPGMLLASDIYDAIGRTLIGQNCELTADYINSLKERGIVGVYIEDDLSRDIRLEQAITERVRQEGMDCVAKKDVDGCIRVAGRIVDEIIEKGNVSFDIADLRSYDNYTFAHSVNVAVLSAAIGMGMRMERSELVNLVTAALMHDLGKLEIPMEILNKPARLTKEEYAIMKSHAEFSYQLLSARWDISAHVKSAVLFHHENEDGSGYPQGLEGAEIPLFAKILHVADVYDALRSKRPYKKPYAPNEAAEYLMGGCGILFDLSIVEKLLACVPLYPKGSEVELSDGRRAIVCENSGAYNLRPLLRLMDGRELDLTRSKNLNITVVGAWEDSQDPDDSQEQQRSDNIRRIERKRLMVVDDMKTNLQLLRGFLEDEYELILLKSGRQVLRYLADHDAPDLILMDIDMPGMDGIETASRIQKMTEEKIPILFVSAICDRQTVMLCRSMNAAGYIVRPYQPVYVKSEILRILKGWNERI